MQQICCLYLLDVQQQPLYLRLPNLFNLLLVDTTIAARQLLYLKLRLCFVKLFGWKYILMEATLLCCQYVLFVVLNMSNYRFTKVLHVHYFLRRSPILFGSCFREQYLQRLLSLGVNFINYFLNLRDDIIFSLSHSLVFLFFTVILKNAIFLILIKPNPAVHA